MEINEDDPLPSWNDNIAKRTILSFVKNVIDENSSYYIEPMERIVTFDNDGTLWCEKPQAVEIMFALDRMKIIKPGYKLKSIDNNTLKELIVQTHSGISTDEFHQIVKDWIETARHPETGKLYTEMVYQPMLEFLTFLQDNDFKTYIVSGGDIDFMRPWAFKVYGIPPENIIGSSFNTKFEINKGKSIMMRLREGIFVNDDAKPSAIQQHIGKRPVVAFGNSTGDLDMLKYTQDNINTNLTVLIQHDDQSREYSYNDSLIYNDVKKQGILVVSMKNDWNIIYPTIANSIIAIDILLKPDNIMLQHAKLVNDKFRKVFPKGFSLDSSHQPHITLLQCYVLVDDLDEIYDIIEGIFAKFDKSVKLTAYKYLYIPSDGNGLAGILIKTNPKLLKLQQLIIAAIKPFIQINNSSNAFYTTPEDSNIDKWLIDYVSTFIETASGDKYIPHVTIGVAPTNYLDKLIKEPFQSFNFSLSKGAIYHLGRFGVAAEELMSFHI